MHARKAPDAGGARCSRLRFVDPRRYGGLSITRSERFDESLEAVTVDDSGRAELQAELGDTQVLTAQVDGAVDGFDRARRLARHFDEDSGYGTLNVPELATAMDVYRP